LFTDSVSNRWKHDVILILILSVNTSIVIGHFSLFAMALFFIILATKGGTLEGGAAVGAGGADGAGT
jgi:Ca2+-dependent lipid-binding protein